MLIKTKNLQYKAIMLLSIAGFLSGCRNEQIIFSLDVNSPDKQKIHFKDPNKWTTDKDKFIYANPNNKWTYAVIKTDQTDYQLDAEITIDIDAEKQAGLGGSQTRQVGLLFKKSGPKKAGAFYMLYRCINSGGIEQWAAIADYPGTDRFPGKESVAALSMDNIEGRHHLKAIVKKDLANFYVDGQLVCIMDISGM
ncbi:MAG: hypothetical protein ACYSSI_03555, partial [Planctomycetota bacterium]